MDTSLSDFDACPIASPTLRQPAGGRPIRARLGAAAMIGALVLTIVVLQQPGAGEESPKPKSRPAADKKDAVQPAKSQTGEKIILVRDTGEFELLVVGPDGKPVPGARVELRGDQQPAAEQIRRGTFNRKHAYGTLVKADPEGRLVVKLPTEPKRFRVSITAPGFGPYWAGWASETHEEPLPARFTAELEAGWSVGGIIVDDQGKPVAEVSVHP